MSKRSRRKASALRPNSPRMARVREEPEHGYGVAQWIAKLKGGAFISYGTSRGVSLVGYSETVLADALSAGLEGKVQLVFTSPPFPLLRRKKYSNLQGAAYAQWLATFAAPLTRLLTRTGSLVIELGNCWEPGRPIMSTIPIESLLAFKTAAGLHLCQEFIWHNPARLPGPAQWVTVDRIRLKDSFSRLWWLSPTDKPKADNRQVLVPYSVSMNNLLRTKKYNAGKRPSEHVIGAKSFLRNNGGAIAPSVLTRPLAPESVIVVPNTRHDAAYQQYCNRHNIDPHPARMPRELAEFFIRLCTDEGDLVLDPFAGTNTTGAAAESLQRDWIAIEANLDYARSGRSRFQTLLRPAASGA